MSNKIEDVLVNKLYEFINFILSIVVKPDIKINQITSLTEEEIDNIKIKYNIEGIILDVDETLRFNMCDIPKANKDWLDMVKTKLKIIVVSNGVDEKIQNYFNNIGIDYIGFAFKPLKKNLIKACRMMNLNPKNVAIVGDDLFSDIYGGKKNNMTTILVKK